MKKFFAILLVFFLVGCSSNIEKTNKVKIVLDWTINTNHTGLYAALENGYFEKEGIEVEVINPPEDGALSLVATNKANFAVSFQDELAPALAESKVPVSALAAIVAHNRSGIVSLKATGITSPKKLEHKNIASWGTEMFDAVVSNVVEADGGDYVKVEKINTTVSDPVAALKSNIDSIWSFYSWDVIAMQEKGLSLNYLEFGKLNPTFDYYTPIIVGNDNFLKENSKTSEKFLKALQEGYDYAIKNPKKAADILLKYAPELDKKLVYASQIYLADEYQNDSKYWGEIDRDRWNHFYQWLYEEKIVEQDLTNKGLNTNIMEKLNK